MKKVELLAPAGNYECFQAAIHAGADAVYLGGEKFGARSFAQNFTEEELCNAIIYAHLFNRKVYLTVNTLMKDHELSEIYDYILPYYLVGLDGVIIQDIGLLCLLKEKFPLLELHISTQMTVTGERAAKLLKSVGAVRIVPARELSLLEIKQMKEAVNIEIETFIHGAMCYGYSGQCLFSSMLGGRSGNRGKCAGSCRQPYQSEINGKCSEINYPLSLKDLCTIDFIPEMIEAGIDSFKIEGRMKKPEYVAGVTAMYRKYIDLYYKTHKKTLTIMSEDRKLLETLYIRSEIHDGYYKKHNGKEMVTLDKPGYSGNDESVLEYLRNKYVSKKMQKEIHGYLTLHIGEAAILHVFDDNHSITVSGGMVDVAQKRSMTEEDVKKQVLKTGTTNFCFSDLSIDIDDNIFISIKALNELRREGLEIFAKECNKELFQKRESSISNPLSVNTVPKTNGQAIDKDIEYSYNSQLHISVITKEQLEVIAKNLYSGRVYVPADLLWEAKDSQSIEKFEMILETFHKDVALYLELPPIVRKRDDTYLAYIMEVLNRHQFTGVSIGNLETYQWLKDTCGWQGKINGNHNLYLWNHQTLSFWSDKISDYCVPLEQNYKDTLKLANKQAEYMVYGRIPMMVSANCIKKTNGICHYKGNEIVSAYVDRFQTKFPVLTNCNHCFNIIYNSVPLSLHQYILKMKKDGFVSFRIGFTDENTNEIQSILQLYQSILDSNTVIESKIPKNYTTGHFKKGAL
ncbi:MAG: U32 family peptidase [Eubacteriales bacterium]